MMGIGDELMVSGAARKAQETDPRKCLPTYKGKPRWNEIQTVWDNNPRIARKGEEGDFQIIVARGMDNMRPYHLAKTDRQWTYNLSFRPEVGELYFTDDEKKFGGHFTNRIIFEPHIKPGASPNKDWGWMRWNKLAWLAQQHGLLVTQLGRHGTKLLDRATFIPTENFRLAAAVLSGARAFVSSEGGLHHAAAALNVPGVVIFGGFTPVELTGYPMHINMGASLSDACGMRTPCAHCADWMKSITPEEVFNNLKGILSET